MIERREDERNDRAERRGEISPKATDHGCMTERRGEERRDVAERTGLQVYDREKRGGEILPKGEGR